MLLRTLALLSVVVATVHAQEAAAAKPFRIHIIGASVSGGFEDGPLMGAKEQGDSVPLLTVLKGWCGEHARASTHGTLEMMALFTKPLEIGTREVEQAKRKQPDAVVAVDFLFWFAYGYVNGQDEAAARAALLEQGLDLLAGFEVPLLIGDLPDMQGADRRMLSPRQIPSPEVLQALNARIAAWAQPRANVRVAPLAQLVRQMKVDGVVLPLSAGEKRTRPGALQQGDRLHATRLGMAFLGFSIQPLLRALLPAGNPLHEQQWTIEQFVAAVGAEGELEALLPVADTVGDPDAAGKSAPAGREGGR
ncbi:MAG: hypothetical protein JNN13_10360 [Planctomycetes bacterium]|nr:hypothetical protein [Planctomycetota bacterium]